jgi:hypothetical protein
LFGSQSPRCESTWGFLLGVCRLGACALLGWVSPSWALPAEVPPACQLVLQVRHDRFTVLAVLSPRMVYSMTEWPRLRDAATREGFQVVAWRSADVTETEWLLAARKAGWLESEAFRVQPVPPDCADWLGRPNHFPYAVVVADRSAVSWPIWGVMPDSAWVDSLLSRRALLAKGKVGGS